jgi:replication factor C large subunit
MLSEKYRPSKLMEVVGQRSTIEKVIEWLRDWKMGKALMLYGPTGIGKTLIADLAAKDNNFNLVEISASDDNIASYVKEVIIPASKERTIFGKRLILIDDVDTIRDRGAIAEMIDMIKKSASPIIFTAGNAYDEKLRAIRNYCVMLKVSRVSSISIAKELRRIVSKESIDISDDMIERIARESDGDIRSAINDLETAGSGEFGLRDRELDIFKVLKAVFQSRNLAESLQAISESDKDVDEIFWWVEQNIPLEMSSNEEIEKAYDILSKADMFRSKIIPTQNFRFKKYMKEMLAGMTFVGSGRKFIMYRPPQRFITLGSTKISRKEEEEFYLGLGMHCSLKKTKEQAPFLKLILGKSMPF